MTFKEIERLIIDKTFIVISVDSINDFIELQEYLFSLDYEWSSRGKNKIINILPYFETIIYINQGVMNNYLTYSDFAYLIENCKNIPLIKYSELEINERNDSEELLII